MKEDMVEYEEIENTSESCESGNFVDFIVLIALFISVVNLTLMCVIALYTMVRFHGMSLYFL